MTNRTIPGFPPQQGRVHEACGAGAHVFAVALVSRLAGPVFWLRERRKSEQLNPLGLTSFVDPARVTLIQVENHKECLAVAEEALRETALPLVVSEISKSLTFTQGRRLQLAAEAGKTTGLCLISEGMGTNATETRWQCLPVFDPADSTRQRWELIKNKSGTLGAWYVRWDQSSRRFALVSPAGQRPGAQGAPG